MDYTKITLKLDEFSNIVGKYDVELIFWSTITKDLIYKNRVSAIEAIANILEFVDNKLVTDAEIMSLTRLLDKMLILNFESLTIEKITE